jgi:hypothetical protein
MGMCCVVIKLVSFMGSNDLHGFIVICVENIPWNRIWMIFFYLLSVVFPCFAMNLTARTISLEIFYFTEDK